MTKSRKSINMSMDKKKSYLHIRGVACLHRSASIFSVYRRRSSKKTNALLHIASYCTRHHQLHLRVTKSIMPNVSVPRCSASDEGPQMLKAKVAEYVATIGSDLRYWPPHQVTMDSSVERLFLKYGNKARQQFYNFIKALWKEKGKNE